jgi:hypothetical protein
VLGWPSNESHCALCTMRSVMKLFLLETSVRELARPLKLSHSAPLNGAGQAPHWPTELPRQLQRTRSSSHSQRKSRYITTTGEDSRAPRNTVGRAVSERSGNRGHCVSQFFSSVVAFFSLPRLRDPPARISCRISLKSTTSTTWHGQAAGKRPSFSLPRKRKRNPATPKSPIERA